jgi:protein phosphatase
MKIHYYLKSDQGLLDKNEDFVGYFKSDSLSAFIVCDGVGGYGNGDYASEFVAKRILEKVKQKKNSTNHIFQDVHSEFQQFKMNNSFSSKTSTTALSVVFREEAEITWSGDCRCYRLRKNHLIQLNFDHSLLMQEYRNNNLKRENFLSYPFKNIITSAIGLEDGFKVDQVVLPYCDQDLFLLCTDGLSDWVSEKNIQRILMEKESLMNIGKKLFEKAIELKSKDNISLILVKIDQQ